MTVRNWHDLETFARYRREDLLRSGRGETLRLRKKTPIIILVMAVLSIFALSPLMGGSVIGTSENASLVTAHSTNPLVTTPVALVYVNPGNVPGQAIGTTFTIQVKVANMPQFNGWDIQISTITNYWSEALNATSLSIAGNIFTANSTGGTPFEIVHCINGIGSGCTSSDGPGIVHSAFADTAFTSGSGLLFSITYKVVSNGSYNPLMFQNSLISSSDPNGVPHISLNSSYGNPQASAEGAGGGRFLNT